MKSEFCLKTPSGKSRARLLGIEFPGTPGQYNAITDVPEVKVGYCTLIEGHGKLNPGKGPVRTGVTAILPRGHKITPCFAGSYCLNGNGEMTGLHWIQEIGQLQAPITITNTHSCGLARDATIQWMFTNNLMGQHEWALPVAAETYDGELNDINGFHVKSEHVFQALDQACNGPLELGSVGGGTGMSTYEFKAGNGSASRIVDINGEKYTLGVFVQSNFGLRSELSIKGISVGRCITGGEFRSKGMGSIICIIATDAPLIPHQLNRISRRVPLGLARTGTVGHHSSGDIFLCFSTANRQMYKISQANLMSAEYIPDEYIDPLFTAVVESIEEAVIDSMVANETMIGANDLAVQALPHDRLVELLKI